MREPERAEGARPLDVTGALIFLEDEFLALGEVSPAARPAAARTLGFVVGLVVGAWQGMSPAEQAAWLDRHWDCGCAERLRGWLLSVEEHRRTRGEEMP